MLFRNCCLKTISRYVYCVSSNVREQRIFLCDGRKAISSKNAKRPDAAKTPWRLIGDMYHYFRGGFRNLKSDLTEYTRIRRAVRRTESYYDLSALSGKEVEILTSLPKNLLRLIPALSCFAIPLVGNLIIPFAYAWPKILLTEHFWTEDQRRRYELPVFQRRIASHGILLQRLKKESRRFQDESQRDAWFAHMNFPNSPGHGLDHYSIQSIKNLFIEGNLTMETLQNNHLGCLLSLHGIQPILNPRRSVEILALVIMTLDKCYDAVGELNSIPTACLQKACVLRGLYPYNLTIEEQRKWLRNWLKISTKMVPFNKCFLLHLSFFLGYEHCGNKMIFI